jgi:folate-binding protein YgfZ
MRFALPWTVLELRDPSNTIISGLTTNTIDASVNSFIDRFGKIVVVFVQKKKEDDVQFILPTQFVGRLRAHLKKYLSIAKAELINIDKNCTFCIAKQCGDSSISFRQSHIHITDTPISSTMTEEEFTCFRIENDISLQGVDFDQEMILNTNWRDVVSFTKGCFLGQEIVARVQNLGKPPKRLVRLLYDAVPDVVYDNKGGMIGEITSLAYSEKYRKYVVFAMIPNREVILQFPSSTIL